MGPEPGTAQWADADGSRMVAEVVQRVDAPLPADPTKDVQWLKLRRPSAAVASQQHDDQPALHRAVHTLGGEVARTFSPHASAIAPRETGKVNAC